MSESRVNELRARLAFLSRHPEANDGDIREVFDELNELMANDRQDRLARAVVHDVEQMSTCYRTRVGAIIMRNGRIISIGYNGTPSGWPHCVNDNDLHRTYEVHAEANAIAFCAQHGMSTLGATIYTTISPCSECAKLIVQAGIVRVVSESVYEHDARGIDILNKSGVLFSL